MPINIPINFVVDSRIYKVLRQNAKIVIHNAERDNLGLRETRAAGSIWLGLSVTEKQVRSISERSRCSKCRDNLPASR